MHPEGLPHWTLKNFLAFQLRHYLANDRAVMVGYFESCDDCEETQKSNPVPTFENLLDGVSEVMVEEEYANRIADILLQRKNAPPRIIEVVDTHKPTSEKLADYKKAGADVFSVEVHNRADVLQYLHSPVKLWAALVMPMCRRRERERLSELLNRLENTPDATFGVEQPQRNSDNLEKQMERVSRQTTYKNEVFEITRYETLPAYQRFVVADKTVSRNDLLSLISAIRVIADQNPRTRMMIDPELYYMQAVIRHQNGLDRNVSVDSKSMADYPSEEQIEWESARSAIGDVLMYYERIFYPKRAWARLQQ